MRRRSVASILVGIAAVILVTSPVEADPLISTVTDPSEDIGLLRSCGSLGCEPYQDIVRASITRWDGMYMFDLSLAEEIPSNPPLRPGLTMVTWSWGLDTNPETFPAGFPGVPGFSDGFEFIVEVSWDGALFAGQVIDRRPLLIGEEAVKTRVRFKMAGSEIVAIVHESRLGSPSRFIWSAATSAFMTESRTGGMYDIDRTAAAVMGTPDAEPGSDGGGSRTKKR